MSKLTAKQELFCRKVMEIGINDDIKNNSDAYRAVFNCQNMKPETVNRKAKELMDNGKIAARIEELRQARNKRWEINEDYVAKRLMEIDEMDPADIFDDDGYILPIRQWPQSMAPKHFRNGRKPHDEGRRRSRAITGGNYQD